MAVVLTSGEDALEKAKELVLKIREV